jgi:hypothetical protein
MGIEPPSHISGDRKIPSGDRQSHNLASAMKWSKISVINPHHAPQSGAIWPQKAVGYVPDLIGSVPA